MLNTSGDVGDAGDDRGRDGQLITLAHRGRHGVALAFEDGAQDSSN